MTFPQKTLKFLALIGLLTILGGIGAAVYFFGGFYSVAANNPDPALVSWALIQVRKASITLHATPDYHARISSSSFARIPE